MQYPARNVSPNESPDAPRPGNRLLLIAFVVALSAILAVLTIVVYQKTDVGGSAEFWKAQDIYWSYVEGTRIANGENPYARIVGRNMQENDKYATYFPGFYLLSALTVKAGADTFDKWIRVWRPIFAVFHWALGVLLLIALVKEGQWILAIPASFYWTLSRFSIVILWIAHLDTFAIFFLVASLVVLRKRPLAGYLLFAISLAIKQIAIFLVPVYLIYAWHRSAGLALGLRIRRVLMAGVAIGSVSLILAAPFLIINPEGFVKSVAFSATRNPVSLLGQELSVAMANPKAVIALPTIDVLLSLKGLPARAIMGGLFVLLYIAYFRRNIGLFTAASLVMALFLSFNTIIFLQYIAWTLPLLPLMVLDCYPSPQERAMPIGSSSQGRKKRLQKQ